MLQAFRSKAGSIFIKIMFGILILSFAAWGVGDMVRNWGENSSVASVGSLEISPQQIRDGVQQELSNLSRSLSTQIDMAQARQFGIIDRTVDQLVTWDLIDLEDQRLGITVPDSVLQAQIMGNPAFKGVGDQFDRNRYLQLLQANGFNPGRFEAQQRIELQRRTLIDAVLGGITPPAIMVDALASVRGETRAGTAVYFGYSAATGVALPDEAAVKAFYDAHPDAFKTPEYRSATILAVTPADATADFKIPDDKLRAAYDERKDSYTTPEKREVQQLLAKDEDTAKRAAAELRTGKSAEEVAKDVPGQAPDAVSLGLVEKGDLPPELATAAFALPEGGVSDPLHTAFGWHVLRIAKIDPSTIQSFDAVRPTLEADLRREEAGSRLDRLNNKIGDALAGGAGLEEAAKANGLKTVKISAIDKVGHDPEGKNVELAFDGILPQIFALKSGETSPLQTVSQGDGGLFAVHVDGITPPARRPLDSVKDEVAQATLKDLQKTAIDKQTSELIAATTAKTLAATAVEHQLTPVAITPLQRNGQANGGIPASVVAELFKDKPSQVSRVETPDGEYVVQLTEVKPGDPTKDAQLSGGVTSELKSTLVNDALTEYDAALRQRYPVRIDRDAIERLF